MCLLSGYSNVFLPDTIGNLKHLRYLDLSYTNIKKLLDSMCFLYNLQILKLNNCRYLVELPRDLHKLSKLRYLDISGTKVRQLPMDVGKLKNLEVLSSFYVDKGSGSNIQQLGELNLHGTLSISELQNMANPLDALAATLKKKVHLVELELEWDANSDNSKKEREVLEKLQPSKHLKELSIRGYGSTLFPDWFRDNSLSNVVSLALSNCENCVSLPPLGILPSLKDLRITGLSLIVVIDSEFYGSSSSSVIPFASLETLQFDDMKGWKEWECKMVRGAFPLLQMLSIRDCPNLKEHLPEKLPSLMELNIFRCKQLVASVPCPPAIHELDPSNCGKLQLDHHPSTLKVLLITGSPTMNIPLSYCYNSLVNVSIWMSSCDSLWTFPLDFFPNLQKLWFKGCSNLEMISQEREQDHNLRSLSIQGCPKFVSFPGGGFSAPKLEELWITRLKNLRSLPERMHIPFPSLHLLSILDCPQLESFSDGGLPSNLKSMMIRNCSKLLFASLKWALPTNTSLKWLQIEEVDLESFPDQGLLPLSLTSLLIEKCSHLKKLDYMGLCHLSSLTELRLRDCPSLQCLPEEGLPKSISRLTIIGDCSSSLKQRCKNPTGEDWGKISHIQDLRIDD